MSSRIRNYSDFLTILKGVKKARDGQHIALCPGHHDTKPSLSVKEVDGKILVQCFAGCELNDILKPLGLKRKDLFLNNHKTKQGQREIEAIYHYTDANGKPYEVVRTRPKGFYQRRLDGGNGYINNLDGIVHTLYQQDKLRRAIEATTPIYCVEGEKDVDRLLSLGFIATTNPMGAGKWRDNYTETLQGADLIIIPDNDVSGRNHANNVAKACCGTAKRIRVLQLLDDDKDVSDFLDSHNADELRLLVDTCPDYEPASAKIKLQCMADVQPEKVGWLWYPYIPKGKVTLLEGDPGMGKSWLSLAIATAVSRGKGLPGQDMGKQGAVVLASAEDGLGDTIRPRLDVMDADIGHIFAIDGPLVLDDEGFTLLENYLDQKRPVLLIVDPLVAYLGSNIDIHRSNETRAVMSRLAKLAERYDVAILAVRHLTKGGMAKPIYRGLGSIDFAAACRSVLLAGCDTENPQNRGLVHIKSNLAPLGKAIGFKLREDSFYWTGKCDLTAGQILATEDTERTSALDEATDFLREELADGPVPASQIFSNARGIRLSEKTIKRAKSKLSIITRRQGKTGKQGGGRFVWELPSSNFEGQEDLEGQGGHIKEVDPLNNSSFKKVDRTLGIDPLNTAAPDGEKPIPTTDLPDYPTHPCRNCGCVDHWLTDWNTWLCSRCHPKPGSKDCAK